MYTMHLHIFVKRNKMDRREKDKVEKRKKQKMFLCWVTARNFLAHTVQISLQKSVLSSFHRLTVIGIRILITKINNVILSV